MLRRRQAFNFASNAVGAPSTAHTWPSGPQVGRARPQVNYSAEGGHGSHDGGNMSECKHRSDTEYESTPLTSALHLQPTQGGGRKRACNKNQQASTHGMDPVARV